MARRSADDFGGRDVAIGLGMQGRIYQPERRRHPRHAGFVGDVGTGVLYFLARIMDWATSWRRMPRRITARLSDSPPAC